MTAMSVGLGVLAISFMAAPLNARRVDQQPASPPTTAAAEVTQCVKAQMVADQLLAAAMARLDGARQANTATDLRAAVDSLQSTMRDVRAQLAACASMPAGREAPMDHSTMPMGTTPETKPAPTAKPVAPAPMDHSKMPMGTPAPPTPAPGATPAATMAPMDHSKMPMGEAPAAKPSTGAKQAAPPAKPPASTVPMDHSTMSMRATADTSGLATDPVCGLKVDPATAPHGSNQGTTYSFCSEQHRDLFQKNPTKYLPKGR